MPAEVSLQAYDKDSLAKELKEFVSTNSTSPQAESVDRVYADLGKPKVRPEHTLIPMKKLFALLLTFLLFSASVAIAEEASPATQSFSPVSSVSPTIQLL